MPLIIAPCSSSGKLLAQRHTLIEAYACTDHAGLTDDDPGPVIDKEALADLRAGMYVDPGLRVRKLANHACEQRNPQHVERVPKALVGDRCDSRIATHHLVQARGSQDRPRTPLAYRSRATRGRAASQLANSRVSSSARSSRR